MLDMAKKPKRATANPWPARLQKLQARLSLKNEAMAEHLGISLHTYLAWKYGKRRPSAMALRVIKSKL